MHTKIEAVTAYSFNGFRLVELNGKVPLKKGWVDLPQNDNRSLNLNYNLGAVLSEADLVIDVDPRNFESNDQPLIRLWQELGCEYKTFTVRTGGGGLHLYFKKPEEIKIKEILPDFKGLEFKAKGRQVVIPPSVHPDTGRKYEALSGDIYKIEEAPKKLLEMLLVLGDIKPSDPSTFVFDDSEANSRRFFDYLKLGAPIAVEGQRGDTTTYAVASMGKDFGISPEKTFELMWAHWNDKCAPPWVYEELWVKVCNAFEYTKSEQKFYTPGVFDKYNTDIKPPFERKKDGSLKPTLVNVVPFLTGYDKTLKNLFRYNVFSSKIEFQRKPFWHDSSESHTILTDADAVEIKYYLADTNKGFDVSIQVVYDAVLLAARKNTYNPVLAYLRNLKWDGVSRIETWLIENAGVVDNVYTREVSKKILVAAVARIFDPGIKFDCMLVLEGRQGQRKSTLCNILGGDWFVDVTLDLKSKDTIELLQGKWICEISEMEVAKKADAQSLKAFLSRRIDRIRLPYARNSQDFPRQNIFIGTINPTGSGYLKDTTGNRRFWVVETTKEINTQNIKNIRDQLFAEALYLYERGEKIYLDDKKAIEIAEKEVLDRQVSDAWLPKISNYLQQECITSITIVEIAHEVLGILTKDVSFMTQHRIATILQVLKFKQSVDIMGNTVYVKDEL